MILLIDNYDSFTYNLAQLMGNLGKDIKVIRNDRIDIEEIKNMDPEFIVISPGPGTPDDAGISREVISKFKEDIPILGVCLGHQSIASVFGGKIIRAGNVLHGKTSSIFHDGKTIYKEIENPFSATRYHSLTVERESIPESLEITAETDEGTIMGLRHKKYPIEGIQFHIESILTEVGEKIATNFFNYYERRIR